LLFGGAIALGCSSAGAAVPSSVASSTTPGNLSAKVTSVTATLEPYNPQFSHHGIPAEQIAFTLSGAPDRSQVVCKVGVFHLGKQVGGTFVGFSGATSQSTSVEVAGDNFAGKPSDAHVQCRIRTVVTVPGAIGKSVSTDSPKRQLSSLWLYVAVVHQSSTTAPVGTVVAQTPPPGSREPTGSIVTLTVSSGPPGSP
jgi:hypothetical protein